MTSDPNKGDNEVGEPNVAYNVDPDELYEEQLDPAIERAWIEEARKVSQAVRDGRVETRDAHDVLAEVRAEILGK